ncbi:MAG TPA: anhydro-N-acetylmuramic acid kinase, partial [Rhodothermales bacterium]|nr:anhydro-N-acetylmuramic acid kinase [Rhodothermales bacterium]
MFLKRLFEKEERLVVGLMSGTSLDGIDVTLARISGSGSEIRINVLHTFGRAYPDALRDRLLRNSLSDKPASVREISQLNTLLPQLYASAV